MLSLATSPSYPSDATADSAKVGRLKALVTAHGGATWRVLRRLGLAPADADDALQEVFCVIAKKADSIAPGSERAFFIGVARRVVSTRRRSISRRPEVAVEQSHFDNLVHPSAQSSPESQAELREAVVELDRILDLMPLEVREVFVFSEIERMTSPEIASLLSIPVGTVSTRLRRGRILFNENVAALHARESDPTP